MKYKYIDKTLTGLKAVEYCRKSTESEERQAFSLEDQHKHNCKVIERLGLVRKKKDIYKESKSAKRRGRPMFNEVIERVESGEFEVIVSWALNRLSRNSVDGALLIELMDEKKLVAIVTATKTYYNSSEDKLLMQIELGLAKKYSDDLGPVALRGMYSKLERGWWPGQPKPGYINVKEKGEVIQKADEERFHLLQKAIHLLLEGYSVKHVLNTLNEDWGYKSRQTLRTGGKPLSESSLYRILRDPFYYGLIQWGGEEVNAHKDLPRLLTESQFWALQERLGGKGMPRPTKHTDIPFRGLIKCAHCGCSIIVYRKFKKLKSGKKPYLYVQCTKKKRHIECTQPHFSFQELEHQVLTLLESIQISDEFFDWAVKWLKHEHQEQNHSINKDVSILNTNLEKAKERESRLLDLLLDGEIDDSTYKFKKDEIKENISNYKSKISQLENDSDDWISRIEKTFCFARDAKNLYLNGNAEEKTRILRILGVNAIDEENGIFRVCRVNPKDGSQSISGVFGVNYKEDSKSISRVPRVNDIPSNQQISIFDEIGSNFLLKDGKLLVLLKKHFIVFRENYKELNPSEERLELMKSEAVKGKVGHFEPMFSSWLGNRESVTDIFLLKNSSTPPRRRRDCGILLPV